MSFSLRALRTVALNGAVVLLSCLLFGLFLEFFVFRWIAPASDVPQNAFLAGTIRYAPDQRGVKRVRGEIAAPYRINAQGWNSGHASYEPTPPVDRERWAVVGDSFVEGLQVPYDASLAEWAEIYAGAQVYRFGLSGSPLSHYVHVVENVVTRYAPQRVFVLLVHNDFVESYRLRIGRYTRSFARYELVGNEVFEVEPEPYVRPALAWVRGSATYRFLVDRMRVDVQKLKELALRRDSEEEFVANVRKASLAEEAASIRRVTEHWFTRMAELRDRHGFDLTVLVDGDRRAIYEDAESEALALNRLVAELGERHAIDVVDLHPVFARAYREDGGRFEFTWDAHWNERAHRLVAREICDHARSPAAEIAEGSASTAAP